MAMPVRKLLDPENPMYILADWLSNHDGNTPAITARRRCDIQEVPL